ncbi:MAG: hypothetical protein KatS3mg023_2979 [Armatimonadota bacterium]|nr:MAG: hypothetical protein KatS3mg023_2979 [Armatimonadota bacterium]
MPSSPLLHVRAVTREGRPVQGAQVLLWRIVPAGVLKPLLGNWSTSETGELRTHLPLPSELLTVASENRTPLRFLVLAWHSQAGWAWSVVPLDALQNVRLALTSAGQATWTVQNCFGESAKGLKGRVAQLRIPGIPVPVHLPQLPGASLQTDAQGKIKVGLPEGATAFWEWEGALPEGMRWRFREPVPLRAGREQRVRYHLGTCEVRGRLVDSRTRQPLREEAVLLHTKPGRWLQSVPTDYLTFTDAQGRFSVYQLPGPTGPIMPAVCRFPDGTEVWTSLIPPETPPPMHTACERWELGEIALQAPDALLEGEVRRADGKPEPFALVVAQGKKTPAPAEREDITCCVATCGGVRKTLRQRTRLVAPFACAFADARGRFRLSVRAGEWQLRAHPSHPPREPAPASAPSPPCQIPSVSTDTRWTAVQVSAGQTVKVRLPLSAGGYVRPIRV